MCCDCWYDVVFADTVNFLGISIVGQSNKGGDGGIYVGSIMKGWVKPEIPNVPLNIYDLVFCLCKIMSTCSVYYRGAVAQDGRIEPGDMILEVNGVSFENMSNDDAVRTLREAVTKPG